MRFLKAAYFLALPPKQATGWNVAYFLFILALTATALTVLVAGTWFGGVRDPRILKGHHEVALFSLGWLWLASRTRPRQATAA